MPTSEPKRVNSILFLYCETPLHAGTGGGIGAIDLPIQRERATGLPILQASGLKGALRAALEIPQGIPDVRRRWREARAKGQPADAEFKQFLPYDVLFGPETDRAHVHAGSLSLSDARLLLLPLRSLVGVFAWATCPLILERLCRDLELVNADNLTSIRDAVNALYRRDTRRVSVERHHALVGSEPDLLSRNRVILEEYTFEAVRDNGVAEAVSRIASLLASCAFPANLSDYWKEAVPKKLVVLHDEPFQALATLGTEIATRVAIDPERGTVRTGALWTEEALPAESLLCAVASFAEPRAYDEDEVRLEAEYNGKKITTASELGEFFKTKLEKTDLVQLGGDETTGRGWTRLRLQP